MSPGHAGLLLLFLVLCFSMPLPGQYGRPARGETIVETRRQAVAELERQGKKLDSPWFLRSIDQEDSRLVNLFLAAGRDPNGSENGGITALMIASGLRRPDSGSLCVGGIAYGCYTVAQRDSPAALAILASLLKNGAAVESIDNDGSTALHKAANAGNVEVAKMLITAGASTNAADHNGTTPLMLAALGGDRVSMAKLLVEHGAAVNAKEGQSSSAFVYAAAAGHPAILKYLMSQGADVKLSTCQGTTALMEAAASGNPAVLKFLLRLRPAIDQRDHNGWTALMYAAFSGRDQAAAVLVKWGANRTLTNRAGETASAIAGKRNFPAVVKVLESR